jgi:hypothetical protein
MIHNIILQLIDVLPPPPSDGVASPNDVQASEASGAKPALSQLSTCLMAPVAQPKVLLLYYLMKVIVLLSSSINKRGDYYSFGELLLATAWMCIPQELSPSRNSSYYPIFHSPVVCAKTVTVTEFPLLLQE